MSGSAPHHTDSDLSEFLLRACHDLRGPLRTIRTQAELAIKQGLAAPDSEVARSLALIVDGSVQAANLIDSLTDYSLALQIDPGTFESVPLGVMLRAAVAKLAPSIREAKVEIVYLELPAVRGNGDRLLQLLELLLDHAIRHRGAESPKIEIAAERQNDDWLVRLRSNGPRIAPDLLERIFKPFERLDRKEKPGPVLATCRHIVEHHGGRLWAESDAGGNVFCFTLPALED